jgi:MoaA/NifB/PqqE/SkfB family radical SAM enzyme
MESLELLQEIRWREPRLRLHVNSVVCRENVFEMVPLGERLRDRFDLDGHYFQIIRGQPMDPALLAVHRDDLSRLYQELSPLYRHYAEKLGNRKGFLSKAGYLGVLNLYHEIQAANLDRHHRWPMPCTAGRNIAVLDANGDLRACELRERLGNVRDYDCDWSRFWDSRKLAHELEAIERDACWCTHVCFIHASLKASAKAMLYDVPRAYLKSGELPHAETHAQNRA